MLISAYFDESGTHDTGTMTMGAVVGDAANWAVYAELVRAVFSDFGVKTFHAQEWKHNKGEFKGMDPTRRVQFIDRFGEAIHQSVACGFCAVLNLEDYRTFYETPLRAAGKQPESAYAICFRAVLGKITEAVLTRPDWRECSIDVVIERGHRNLRGAEAAFNAAREIVRSKFGELLGTFKVSSRGESPELCAADSLATSGWSIEAGKIPKLRLEGESRTDASYRGNYYRLEVGQDALVELANARPSPRRLRKKAA